MRFRVRVGNWSCSRLVTVEKGLVSFEVARIECSDCPTCRQRLHFVGERFGPEVMRSYVGGGVLYTVPLPEEHSGSQLKVAQFLQSKLGIAVSPAG